jgi:hypothetical protein
MKDEPEVSIKLSPAQVQQVVRAAGQHRSESISGLLLAALENAQPPGQDGNGGSSALRDASQDALERALDDPHLSHSLLRGLAVLSCYGPERPWLAIVDLAKRLRMSPSTTHRYVKTLRALGLLEQNPLTREYRPAG